MNKSARSNLQIIGTAILFFIAGIGLIGISLGGSDTSNILLVTGIAFIAVAFIMIAMVISSPKA